MIGRFWSGVSEEFPGRELRPAVQAVASGSEVTLSLLPQLRALLLAPDGATLLQLQQDRFYYNWRRSDFESQYPRFSDHDGREGVGSLAIQQFGRFAEFCKVALSRQPAIESVELAKVDLLVEGKHWSDFGDLACVLPWLRNFSSFSNTGEPTFALRFEEQREAGLLSVGMAMAAGAGAYAGKRVVKLEGRLTSKATDPSELPNSFTVLNRELNEVFEELIPEEERERRFMKGGTVG